MPKKSRSSFWAFLALGLVAGTVMVFGSGAVVAAQAPATMAESDVPTYHKDIEPIMQRSCQRCHNPESVAPMSLLTYEQVRPFARAIKLRTGLARSEYGRGAMPPWYLEKDIGIQQVKDDVSLSDEEIEMVAAWADAGAPRGNPDDAPPPIEISGAGEWALGKPDLVVSSPRIWVDAQGSDWSGTLGRTPLGLTEDRYAASAEYMETRQITGDMAAARSGRGEGAGLIGGLFVFHHMTTSVSPPTPVGGEVAEEDEGEAPVGLGSLPIHEVGRNPDVFPQAAGRLLPAGGFVNWGNAHIHPTGAPGSEGYAQMNIGFKLHPKGYQATREFRGYTFGRSEIQVNPMQGAQREDSYFVAPQPMKLINYEPHMHANGVRMCLQAAYGKVVETLNCSGYDHDWVRNYYYEENYEPLIPKGTVLHAISWFDNTSQNENVVEPRNVALFGNSSQSNMFIVFNFAEFLTDEEYVEEVRKRQEYMALTGEDMIGCPGCYLPLPDMTAEAEEEDGAEEEAAPEAVDETASAADTVPAAARQ